MGHYWDIIGTLWDIMGHYWDIMGHYWDINGTLWDIIGGMLKILHFIQVKVRKLSFGQFRLPFYGEENVFVEIDL